MGTRCPRLRVPWWYNVQTCVAAMAMVFGRPKTWTSSKRYGHTSRYSKALFLPGVSGTVCDPRHSRKYSRKSYDELDDMTDLRFYANHEILTTMSMHRHLPETPTCYTDLCEKVCTTTSLFLLIYRDMLKPEARRLRSNINIARFLDAVEDGNDNAGL